MSVIRCSLAIFYIFSVFGDIFGQIRVGRPITAPPRPALAVPGRKSERRDVVQDICGISRGGDDDPFQLQLANFGTIGAREGNFPELMAEPTIVGGQDARMGDACWQAKLSRDGFFICGGSIIGRRTILTAVHCVINFNTRQVNDPNRFKVQTGAMASTTSIRNPDGISDGCAQEFNVIRIVINSRFNKNSNENDIALLTVDDDIDFGGSCVCPICLRPKVPPVGEICSVSGFGLEKEGGGNSRRPTPLKAVHLNILPTRFGGSCFIQNGTNGPPNMNNILCAGDRPGEDSCQGDSGGPLVCFDARRRSHYQVGIVSYGMGCARGIGGVYTRVPNYLDWLRLNAHGDQLSFADG
ncbi:hypothetical protein RvY_03819 [Ramazzottius varieornatus]|uniref:Peptidase S1 domain-containing protein n=1 Tax=Ramazzottius varieornatus TaxID=947166 RepID=A0A1D1UV15_RAMVA|nr:hypothetical protein RvY_03819 [Ramazzottius varieornatus]